MNGIRPACSDGLKYVQFQGQTQMFSFIHNGFGRNKNAVLLHICPKDKEAVFFNFHYPKKKKFIGIFPYTSEETYYLESYPLEKVHELIHAVFNDKYEYILKL